MCARKRFDGNFGDANWRKMMDPNSEEYDPGFVGVEKESERVHALKQEMYNFASMLENAERDIYGNLAKEPSDVAEILEDFERDIPDATESEEEKAALKQVLEYAKKHQGENAKQYLLESVQRYGSALLQGNHEYGEDIREDLELRTFRFLEHIDIGVGAEEIEKTKEALERYKREPKLYHVDEIVERLQEDIKAVTEFFASRARQRKSGVRSFTGDTGYSVTFSEGYYSWGTRTVDAGSLATIVRELQDLVATISNDEAYTEAQEMLEYYYQKIMDIPAIQTFFELLGSYIQDIQEGQMDTTQKREVYEQLLQQIESIQDPSFAVKMQHELFMASMVFGVPKPEEIRKTDYSILGVDIDADAKTLKKAYRALAKEHHPDKYTSFPEPVQKFHEERFKEIAEAYERLTSNR